MIKANKQVVEKYFIEDIYEGQNNRVFDSLGDVEDYVKELRDEENSSYIEENINIYSLENATPMKIESEVRLIAK